MVEHLIGGMVCPAQAASRAWETISRLDSGGQGTVYIARERFRDEHHVEQAMLRAIDEIARRGLQDATRDATVLAAIRGFATFSPRLFAFKLFEPRGSDDNGRTLERSEEEVRVLTRAPHPRLIELVDHGRLDGTGAPYTVYRYYKNGTLKDRRSAFEGRALACLRAVADILEAIAHLHAQQVFHRDLKPANVFADDEGRWLVGDLGLVLDERSEHSITRTDETVGNWEFCPAWAGIDPKHQRDPRFDVYAVAKILWWLASGRKALLRERYDKPENNLVTRFAGDHGMELVHRIVGWGLAEEPNTMHYKSAAAMQTDVLAAIEELETRRTLPPYLPRDCFACQRGTYMPTRTPEIGLDHWMRQASHGADPDQTFDQVTVLRCTSCGNVQWFARNQKQRDGN